MTGPGPVVERNLHAWLLAQAASVPAVEVHLEPDVTWIFTHHSAPGNTVVLARFGREDVAAVRSREIRDYHLDRQASSYWITGPATTPAHLGPAILRPLGYSCRIHYSGMLCDLTRDVPATANHRPPVPGLTVGVTQERPRFEPLTTESRRRQKAIADGMRAHEPQRIWYFGAWLDGKPVGRATLFTPGAAEDAAGIYDVEVLKRVRNRGIGSMLVHAALQQAIANGCKQAVLAATGAGLGIYQRLGFRPVTRLSFWMYGKTRQAR